MTPIKAWAGVVDDALEIELWPKTGDDAYARLYTSRVEARKHYGAVVRVLVIAADDVEEYPE